MLKVIVAERILELVTTVSRAESIVGDLLEEASNRNTLWFLFTLLRIFTSLIGRDIRDRWLRLLLRIVWAIIELIILIVLFGAGFHILRICVIGILNLFGLKLVSFRAQTSDWIYALIGRIALPFLIGWRIARRSDGHELPSGCAFMAITLGLSLVFQMAMTPHSLLLSLTVWLRSVLLAIVSTIEFGGPLMTGAIMFRNRSNARYRKMQPQKQ